jgi:hypothetical protein
VAKSGDPGAWDMCEAEEDTIAAARAATKEGDDEGGLSLFEDRELLLPEWLLYEGL